MDESAVQQKGGSENRWMDESAVQPKDGSENRWMDESAVQPKDGSANRLTDGSANRLLYLTLQMVGFQLQQVSEPLCLALSKSIPKQVWRCR